MHGDLFFFGSFDCLQTVSLARPEQSSHKFSKAFLPACSGFTYKKTYQRGQVSRSVLHSRFGKEFSNKNTMCRIWGFFHANEIKTFRLLF